MPQCERRREVLAHILWTAGSMPTLNLTALGVNTISQLVSPFTRTYLLCGSRVDVSSKQSVPGLVRESEMLQGSSAVISSEVSSTLLIFPQHDSGASSISESNIHLGPDHDHYKYFVYSWC